MTPLLSMLPRSATVHVLAHEARVAALCGKGSASWQAAPEGAVATCPTCAYRWGLLEMIARCGAAGFKAADPRQAGACRSMFGAGLLRKVSGGRWIMGNWATPPQVVEGQAKVRCRGCGRNITPICSYCGKPTRAQSADAIFLYAACHPNHPALCLRCAGPGWVPKRRRPSSAPELRQVDVRPAGSPCQEIPQWGLTLLCNVLPMKNGRFDESHHWYQSARGPHRGARQARGTGDAGARQQGHEDNLDPRDPARGPHPLDGQEEVGHEAG